MTKCKYEYAISVAAAYIFMQIPYVPCLSILGNNSHSDYLDLLLRVIVVLFVNVCL